MCQARPNRAAMRTATQLRAALCIAVMALSQPLTRAIADDTAPAVDGGNIARPSVEELAIPLPENKAVLQKSADSGRETDTREAMCLMIESAARANALPLEFFARVIWQESRFQSDAVGPVTRSGQRAQGIAQFMPGTANERRLLDPFNPVQALPKSAEFLRELRNQFGNLGLAAAAYNAGPKRVQDWLAGNRPTAQGARNYLVGLNGHPGGGRGGCRNGSRAPARCRRRRATTCWPLPAARSRTGLAPPRTASRPTARPTPV